MPKIQGLWRPHTKIDEADFETAKTRTAARLADLFGVDAPVPDGDAPLVHADQAAEPRATAAADDGLQIKVAVASPGSSRRRHARVVDEGPGVIGVMAQPDRADLDLVGVMARPDETIVAGPAGDPATAGDPGIGGDPAVMATALPRSAHALEPRRPRSRGGPADRHGSGRRNASPSPSRPGGARAVGTPSRSRSEMAPAAACPYCAVLLWPPPVSSQRCARCRQRIIVRRVDGRAVYLAEAAVPVFQAERRRIAGAGRLNRERARWLKLATAAGAPADRVARLGAAEVSEQVVEACRTLYLGAVERSFRTARRERRWEDASHIRRAQALALHRAAGSPMPPPEGVVGLHRDGTAAELRGIAEIAREAELIGAACCDACRADDGRIFRVTAELRTPRLPHEGCPRGLCRCRWDLPARYRTTVWRYLRRRPRADKAASTAEDSPTA